MKMRIASWNGQSLNNSDFDTTVIIGAGNGAAAAMPNFVDVGEDYPVLTGKTAQGAQYTIRVRLKGATDVALEIQRDLLFSIFDPYDFGIKTLLGEDTEDGDAEWYLEGETITPPMLIEQTIADYAIGISLKIPYWQKVIEESTSFNIGSSTEDNEVDPGGNVPVPPIITISPQAAKGSPINQNRFFVGVHPPGKSNLGSINPAFFFTRPIDLTPAGLDTAALVLDGKMRSDGNDVRVIVDGVEVPRFFGAGTKGMDTATTHIWAYLTMPFYTPLTLVSALDGSTTPTSITFDAETAASEIAFDRVPADLLIGTEIISYTGLSRSYYPNNTAVNKVVRYVVTGITRAAKGTAIAAHLTGVEVNRFHQDIWIVYGDPSASAPLPRTDWIPSFDLEQSTNDEWIYDNQFSATDALDGTQGFTRSPIMNGPGSLYNAAENLGSRELNYTAPAEVCGLRLNSKLLSGIPYSDTTSRPMWRFNNDHVEIDTIEYEGQRKRTGVESGVVTLGYRDTRGVYQVAVTLDPIVAVDTWEPFDGVIDLAAYRTKDFTFRATGGLGTTLPLPEMLVELTYVKIIHAEPPTVFIPSAEAASYELAGYIENVENNHRIGFKNIPMLTGDILTIDCVEMTATLSDGRNARGYLEFTGVVRDEWMLLINGSNTIRFSDTNTTDVDIVVTTTPRNTI